jgi:hypothetical protein
VEGARSQLHAAGFSRVLISPTRSAENAPREK